MPSHTTASAFPRHGHSMTPINTQAQTGSYPGWNYGQQPVASSASAQGYTNHHAYQSQSMPSDPYAQPYYTQQSPSAAGPYPHSAHRSPGNNGSSSSYHYSGVHPQYQGERPISYNQSPTTPVAHSPHSPTSPTSSSPGSVQHAQSRDRDRFYCNQCPYSFTRQHDLKRHITSVHSQDAHQERCPNCRKTFSRSDALKRHLDKSCTSRDDDYY
jgi:uncharacterized C2H2 Zn-finger protein